MAQRPEPSDDNQETLSYMHGGCHALALALHEIYGYEICGMWDEYATDVPDGQSGLVHFYVALPDGRGLDAKGVRSEEDMAGDFGFGLGDLVVQPHEAKDLREFSPTSEADLSAAMDFACRLHTETGLDAPSPR